VVCCCLHAVNCLFLFSVSFSVNKPDAANAAEASQVGGVMCFIVAVCVCFVVALHAVNPTINLHLHTHTTVPHRRLRCREHRVRVVYVQQGGQRLDITRNIYLTINMHLYTLQCRIGDYGAENIAFVLSVYNKEGSGLTSLDLSQNFITSRGVGCASALVTFICILCPLCTQISRSICNVTHTHTAGAAHFASACVGSHGCEIRRR
jgi:hypothetical protein